MSADPANSRQLAPTRRRPSTDFSLAGLVYCAMVLFMGLAAVNTQANLLFGVFGLMIGIMGVSWVAGRAVVRQLAIRREIPTHLVVGVPTTIYYHLTNQKRYWPSLSVSITELDGVRGFKRPPQGYMLHAAPRMTATAPAEIIPARRGVYEFDRVQLATSFPFGFIRRARVAHHKDVLLVFPAVAQVERRLLTLCQSADSTGESLRPRPGGTDEFYGVRQYRGGDSPRWIHWRRSARTGVLVTREMTRVAPPRLVIAIDTFSPSQHSSSEEIAQLERAIAMAASLASAALEDGLEVGICGWSGEPINVEPGRGKQHREDALTLLARLPANHVYRFDELLASAQRMVRSSATVVLVTPADVQADLLVQSRGGVMVLSAAREDSRGWFQFPANVDFATCGPGEEA
jgi:uncharacterized protein (DUF58 family)